MQHQFEIRYVRRGVDRAIVFIGAIISPNGTVDIHETTELRGLVVIAHKLAMPIVSRLHYLTHYHHQLFELANAKGVPVS
jgi:hypothetical protein